jgi:hypothetical protein
MLVSELIETDIPYREKKALRAIMEGRDDTFVDLLRDALSEVRPAGISDSTWVTYQSLARKSLDRALGVAPKLTRATKAQTETADELWRACLVALLPTHQVGEAVERADKAVAAWRRRVANR